LLEEFEQLVFSVTPSRSPGLNSSSNDNENIQIVDVMGREKSQEGEETQCNPCTTESKSTCPFLASDIDSIVTMAFNSSILLIELDQLGRMITYIY
jgi:hypothetical protein